MAGLMHDDSDRYGIEMVIAEAKAKRQLREGGPNIPDVDVNKMAWSAAIVPACIVLYGLFTVAWFVF